MRYEIVALTEIPETEEEKVLETFSGLSEKEAEQRFSSFCENNGKEYWKLALVEHSEYWSLVDGHVVSNIAIDSYSYSPYKKEA